MLKFNKKGFAFSELLMVTVVITGIFMIIYTNIFPIMGELENRKEYNDLSANYAAFYLRKALLNVDLSSILGIDGYKVLYNGDTTDGTLEAYSKYLSEAGISEVILTNDVLSNVKNADLSGELKNFAQYIDYLPSYLNLSDSEEQYRLLIRTKTGFATTLIKFSKADYNDILEFDVNNVINEFKASDLETLFIPDFVTGIASNVFDLSSFSGLKNVYMNSLIDVSNDSFVGSRESGNELNLFIRDCSVGQEESIKSSLNISNDSIKINCMLENSSVEGDTSDEEIE